MITLILSETLLLAVLLLCLQLFMTSNFSSTLNTFKPLEAGFESLALVPIMSSPFFMLAVLFVLFDVELILLIPIILSTSCSFIQMILWGAVLSLMAVTLMMEWLWSGLKWTV